MYARNCTMAQLETVAKELGFKLDANHEPNRKRIRFTIKPNSDTVIFRKVKFTPNHIGWNSADILSDNPQPIVDYWKRRKVNAICFHGHYAFFSRLFGYAPNAEISSSYFGDVKYTRETLRENAQEFGMRPLGNPGNIYNQFQIREECCCLDNDPNPWNIY